MQASRQRTPRSATYHWVAQFKVLGVGSSVTTSLRLSAIAILLVGSNVSGCGKSQSPLMGRAIAGALETRNGTPIVVLDTYACAEWTGGCIPDGVRPNSEAPLARDIAAGLAEGLGIPVQPTTGFRAPPCPWAEHAERTGLVAQFMRPPLIQGDTARLELLSACNEDGASFLQTHEFVLRRDGSKWIVVRRTETSIT